MTTADSVGQESLLHNQDYLRYWFARAVSTLGSQATYVAFPLMALGTFQSALAASLVTACSYGSTLVVGLHAGVLADQFDRKWLMVSVEVLQAMAMLAMATMLLTGWVPLAGACAVAFVNGALFAVYASCSNAALPDLVGPDLLPRAIARNQMRDFALAVAGPPLGGLLIVWSIEAPFLFNVGTLLLAAVLTATIRRPLPSGRAAVRGRASLAGVRLVLRDRVLRWATLFLAGQSVVLTSSFFAVVALLANRSSAVTMGVALACQAGGGLLGSLAATRIHARVGGTQLLLAQGFSWTAGLGLLAVTVNPVVVCVVLGFMWLTVPATRIAFQTHLTVVTPPGVRGRVQSVVFLVQSTGTAIGPLLAGVVISATSDISTLLVTCLISGMVTVSCVLLPNFRARLTWRRNLDE
ncbi:MFS transporter [Lentzea alba]|uniref:MFS transporter n=1 Tax=Lentzea alba TaxID=2714351 RepID=UPI0039BFB815